MKPTIEGLTAQFTALIGPEAFAKAEAAIAAAKAAAAAAAAAKPAATNAGGVPLPRVAPANPNREGTAPTSAISAGGSASKPAPAAALPPSIAGAVAPASAGQAGGLKPALPATPVADTPPAASPRIVPPGTATSGQSTTLPPKGGTTNQAATPVAPRPATPSTPLAAVPALPLQATPHAAKGYDLDATVAPRQVVEAAELVDRAGFALDTITGVDWIAQNEMEVVYDYFHPTESLHVVVRTRVPRATPELPSITAVFPGANWHERETHDFFGIRFVGHPNLKPFLLPEDANFHPLRKDYQP